LGREQFDKFINIVLKDFSESEKLLREEPELINATNDIGETVLHFLVVENNLKEVEWLFNKGANVDTVNNFGNTPLSEAAGLGYKEMCQFLIEKGADHKVRDENGDTALSQAATSDEVAVVNLLLDLIKPEEQLTDYFTSITYDILLDKESSSAKAMSDRGLNWPTS